jgi:hypothetical protein
MKKILIFIMMLFVCMTSVVAYSELKSWYQYGDNPAFNWQHYTGYFGGDVDFTNISVTKQIQFGSSDSFALGDIDYDGNVEYATVSETNLYIFDSSFNLKAFKDIGRHSTITLLSTGCSVPTSNVNRLRIVVVGGSEEISTYCFDGSTITQESANYVGMRPSPLSDFITCAQISGTTYGCFAVMQFGIVYCQMSPTYVSCTDHSTSNDYIVSYNLTQRPAVKDLDSDGHLEAVFYARNPVSNNVGFEIIKDDGTDFTSMSENLGIFSLSWARQRNFPTILSNNFIVGEEKTSSDIDDIKVFNSGGIFQYYAKHCENDAALCNNPADCTDGKRYISNIWERDSDGDNVNEQMCFYIYHSRGWHSTSGRKTDTITCQNIDTGAVEQQADIDQRCPTCGCWYKKDISSYISGSYEGGHDWSSYDFIGTELLNSKNGDEAITGAGYIIFSSNSSNLNMVGIPLNSTNSMFLGEWGGSQFPDIFFSSNLGTNFFETNRSSIIPPSPPLPPQLNETQNMSYSYTYPSANNYDWWNMWWSPTANMSRDYKPEVKQVYFGDMKVKAQINLSLNQSYIYSGVENVVTGDFNGDGQIEIAHTWNNHLYIRDTSFNVKASLDIGDNATLTVIPEPCSSNYKTLTILLLNNMNNHSQSYCYDGSLYLRDSVVSGLLKRQDGIGCEYDESNTPICFWRTAAGYASCDLTNGIFNCNQFNNTNVAGYSGDIIPSVGDIRGENDIEALFYNSNFAVVCVDELGNQDWVSQSTGNWRRPAPMITSTGDIFVSGCSGSGDLIFGSVTYYVFNADNGTIKNTLTGTYTPYSGHPEGAGTIAFGTCTNPVEMNNDICAAYKEAYFSRHLLCWDKYTYRVDSTMTDNTFQAPACDVPNWEYDISGGLQEYLLAVELDSSHPDKEILFTCMDHMGGGYYQINYAVSYVDETLPLNNTRSFYQVEASESLSRLWYYYYPYHVIPVRLGNTRNVLDLLFYDNSGLVYLEASGKPELSLLNLVPSANVSVPGTRVMFQTQGYDPGGDVMSICLDADWIPSHESFGGTIDDSQYLSCYHNLTNEFANFGIISSVQKGAHWKIYVTNSHYYKFNQTNTYEGNLIWHNGTTIEKIRYLIFDGVLTNLVTGVRISVENFTRGGEPRIWEITVNGGGKFNIPQGTWSVSVHDPLGRFDDISKMCDTTASDSIVTCLFNVTLIQPPPPQCSDGIDNDADGLIDYPADPGCSDPSDITEASQCNDGIDNDGDGKIDYPADPGCTSAIDDDETNPQCNDGIDNDADGFIDFPSDPGCSSLLDNSEGNIIGNVTGLHAANMGWIQCKSSIDCLGTVYDDCVAPFDEFNDGSSCVDPGHTEANCRNISGQIIYWDGWGWRKRNTVGKFVIMDEDGEYYYGVDLTTRKYFKTTDGITLTYFIGSQMVGDKGGCGDWFSPANGYMTGTPGKWIDCDEGICYAISGNYNNLSVVSNLNSGSTTWVTISHDIANAVLLRSVSYDGGDLFLVYTAGNPSSVQIKKYNFATSAWTSVYSKSGANYATIYGTFATAGSFWSLLTVRDMSLPRETMIVGDANYGSFIEKFTSGDEYHDQVSVAAIKGSYYYLSGYMDGIGIGIKKINLYGFWSGLSWSNITSQEDTYRTRMNMIMHDDIGIFAIEGTNLTRYTYFNAVQTENVYEYDFCTNISNPLVSGAVFFKDGSNFYPAFSYSLGQSLNVKKFKTGNNFQSSVDSFVSSVRTQSIFAVDVTKDDYSELVSPKAIIYLNPSSIVRLQNSSLDTAEAIPANLNNDDYLDILIIGSSGSGAYISRPPQSSLLVGPASITPTCTVSSNVIQVTATYTSPNLTGLIFKASLGDSATYQAINYKMSGMMLIFDPIVMISSGMTKVVIHMYDAQGTELASGTCSGTVLESSIPTASACSYVEDFFAGDDPRQHGWSYIGSTPTTGTGYFGMSTTSSSLTQASLVLDGLKCPTSDLFVEIGYELSADADVTFGVDAWAESFSTKIGQNYAIGYLRMQSGSMLDGSSGSTLSKVDLTEGDLGHNWNASKKYKVQMSFTAGDQKWMALRNSDMSNPDLDHLTWDAETDTIGISATPWVMTFLGKPDYTNVNNYNRVRINLKRGSIKIRFIKIYGLHYAETVSVVAEHAGVDLLRSCNINSWCTTYGEGFPPGTVSATGSPKFCTEKDLKQMARSIPVQYSGGCFNELLHYCVNYTYRMTFNTDVAGQEIDQNGKKVSGAFDFSKDEGVNQAAATYCAMILSFTETTGKVAGPFLTGVWSILWSNKLVLLVIFVIMVLCIPILKAIKKS